MINCVIIDDEPLAREGIADYVREMDFLNLIATGENPLELSRLMDKQPVDLLFLDIQMPKMNGIEYLRVAQRPPMVILTTAFPSYALEGFQLNVLDYLLKPITFDRFFQSANKARNYFQLLNRPSDPAAAAVREEGASKENEKPDYFFIKCGSKYEKIFFADILYAQGTQNYVTLYTTKGKYMTLLYLKDLEEKLDSSAFIRIHKSYIVAIDKIDSVEGNELSIRTHRVPMSRNYRETVMARVVVSKLWDKHIRP